MELIRRLPARKNKKGKWESWGIYLCPFCLKEVEKRISNGKKCKSCGCKTSELKSESIAGKNHPLYGKHHSEETRQKQSNTKKDNYSAGKKSPMFGKNHSEESKQKIREGRKDKYIGENSPMYGKRHSKESKQKMKEAHIGKHAGELNSQWQGGKSFEVYPIEFKQIKKFILERDEYRCQFPGCTEVHDRLHVHHIDFDKKNNTLENLITLGTSCHAKTNGKKKRQYFTEFYQNIMEDVKCQKN